MASRPTGYGLTADTKRKIDGKYSLEQQIDVQKWMEGVTQEKLTDAPAEQAQPLEFANALKDGVYLCRLANILEPGAIKKYNNPARMPFHMMENIEKFLNFCSSYGMKKTDQFPVPDLYERQNMPQVVNTLLAVGRTAQKNGFNAPFILGPKESNPNKREFTEEQLKQGESIIGLQMGSNKGASQAGMIMGKNRQIID